MPKAVREPEVPMRTPSGGAASPSDQVTERRSMPDWVGRRPETLAVLTSLLGLFVQVVGYSRGWAGDESVAIVLWYVGMVVVVAPFAALLLVPGRTAHQRLGASLAMTLIVYASWLLSNPLVSTRFDENLHVTTLVDLVENAEFFQLNSMLPVSPHFPGLELATAGVHWLTGLPLFACQVLVVAAARITFAASLFLLASRIGRSTTVGAMRGPALCGEQPVLLLQRPVLLPDRGHRDGHGGVLSPGPSFRQPTGAAVVPAGDRPGVPRRARHHPPPDQLDHVADPVGARRLLLVRRRAAPLPVDASDRRARHRGRRRRGPRSSRPCSSTT